MSKVAKRTASTTARAGSSTSSCEGVVATDSGVEFPLMCPFRFDQGGFDKKKYELLKLRVDAFCLTNKSFAFKGEYLVCILFIMCCLFNF